MNVPDHLLTMPVVAALLSESHKQMPILVRDANKHHTSKVNKRRALHKRDSTNRLLDYIEEKGLIGGI